MPDRVSGAYNKDLKNTEKILSMKMARRMYQMKLRIDCSISCVNSDSLIWSWEQSKMYFSKR